MITDLICSDCGKRIGQIQLYGDFSHCYINAVTCQKCLEKFYEVNG